MTPDPAVGEIVFAGATTEASLFRRPTQTFVGRHGIARYTQKWGGKTKAEVVLFADVREVRVTRSVAAPVARARMRTTWAFYGDGPDPTLVIEASTRSGEAPPADDASWFGAAAERAYSEHVLARHEEELRAHGRIRFALSARDAIAIGAGFVELEQHGARARFDVSEVRLIEVARGHLVVRTGESGSAAMGIHRLRIDEPHIVHALAIVLQELAGVRMG